MARKQKFMKHIMIGISFMIPIAVAGGILGTLAKAFDEWNIGSAVAAGTTLFSNLNPSTWVGFWWGVNKLSSYAMDLAVAVMTTGATYSMAGRPGTVSGLTIGYCSAQSETGFLGGLFMAFIIGNFVNWMKTQKLPKWCEGLMSVMFIPVISTLVCGMTFLCVFPTPLARTMSVFQQWIISLNGGVKSVIGAAVGTYMGFDIGGPVNKTASMAANALGADRINGPTCTRIIGGMTSPTGLFIIIMIKKNEFTRTELGTTKTALSIGLCLIIEGVLPFATADPARFILSSMTDSAVVGVIAVGMGCESVTGYGDISVVLPPALVMVLQSPTAI